MHKKIAMNRILELRYCCFEMKMVLIESMDGGIVYWKSNLVRELRYGVVLS